VEDEAVQAFLLLTANPHQKLKQKMFHSIIKKYSKA
jgi:hypothetical protein